MVNLIDLLQSKIELFRLEQRYTKGRNRRSTFVSEAQYVDGEYVYGGSSGGLLGKRSSVVVVRDLDSEDGDGEKRKSRWGSMKEKDKESRRKNTEGKRKSLFSVREVGWENSS